MGSGQHRYEHWQEEDSVMKLRRRGGGELSRDDEGYNDVEVDVPLERKVWHQRQVPMFDFRWHVEQ